MKNKKNLGFKFKQFFVSHDISPMKVTTDSCLLGAFAPLPTKLNNVLDVGCGCGILALMIAQRTQHLDCKIEAIDIDEHAILQTVENVKHSPFNNVSASLADFNHFSLSCNKKYQLIITNPPYFCVATPCLNIQRETARYTNKLTHEQLIKNVNLLLNEEGHFAVVLPFNVKKVFVNQCLTQDLFLNRCMYIKNNQQSDVKLVLLNFSKKNNNQLSKQELILKDENNIYTQEFRLLLNEFYLFEKQVYKNK